ncbi:t-SNARE, partial [Cladochytrium replicatum]
FYNKIDEIQNEICTLVEHIHALEERHKSVLSSVGTEESSRSQARLSVLQNEVDALFSRARAGMMELRQLRTDGGQGVLQQKVLAQKLQEVAVRYRELQTTYRSSYVKRIERQVRIVNPDATEEEIESAVVFGNVFGQQLLSSQIASQRQILSDVQARQREIQQIDQSITELLTLFEEMQSMIDSQGEVVTNIETRVEKAAEDIVQSSSKLARAVEHRRSSRRMAWIICGIVTFVIIIILILL